MLQIKFGCKRPTGCRDIHACVRNSPNGTIGNFTNGTIGSQWYHWQHENPERFSATNGTIGANVTIGKNVGTNGTIGSPNGTIGKPNGVNSSIMIETTSLFLHSYFVCVYFRISIFWEYHPDKNSAYL